MPLGRNGAHVGSPMQFERGKAVSSLEQLAVGAVRVAGT